MTKQVQRRRGTATQHTSFTGAEGEISVNTTNKSIHVHDGVTAGGIEGARADMTNVSDGDLNSRLAGNTLSSLTITSADINGGTIDGTVIGGATPAAGSFTTGSFTGDVSFGDNDKAIFGAGSDLQIYHDGSNSYIQDTGAGDLFIDGNTNLVIRDQFGGTVKAKFITGGANEFYYAGSPKLATTSTGIDVTGTVTADGLTVDGNADVGGQVRLRNNDLISFQDTSGNRRNVLQFDTSNEVIIGGAGAGISAVKIKTNSAIDRLNIAYNGDISFYEDTGTTPKFFWDASAESLGIGISPSTPLHVNGAATVSGITYSTAFVNTSNGTSYFTDASTGNGIYVGGSTGSPANTVRLLTNASEAARIDASGNLLVGKTSANSDIAGFEANASGFTAATRDNGTVFVMDRLTSDGGILSFRKDNSTVGSIGANGGDVYIGTGDTGVRFVDSLDCLLPLNTSTNATRDASIDIGYNDGGRFKDLYLSGGVYLGGTGSANKLDDYEEGTWTPTFAGLTIGNGTVSGTYTKIGRQVTIVFGFDCGSTTSVGTLGNITGLPFASANIWSGYIKVHGVAFDSGARWYEAVAVLKNNSDTIYIPSTTNLTSVISASNPMTWVNNDTLVFTATYFTA